MHREAWTARELTYGAVSSLAIANVFSDTNSNPVIWLCCGLTQDRVLKLPEVFQAEQNLWCPYLCCEAGQSRTVSRDPTAVFCCFSAHSAAFVLYK